MLSTYGFFTGKDNVDPEHWFNIFGPDVDNKTGRMWKLIMHQWRGELSRNFWSVRVSKPCNGLSDLVKRAERIDELKN